MTFCVSFLQTASVTMYTIVSKEAVELLNSQSAERSAMPGGLCHPVACELADLRPGPSTL